MQSPRRAYGRIYSASNCSYKIWIFTRKFLRYTRWLHKVRAKIHQNGLCIPRDLIPGLFALTNHHAVKPAPKRSGHAIVKDGATVISPSEEPPMPPRKRARHFKRRSDSCAVKGVEDAGSSTTPERNLCANSEVRAESITNDVNVQAIEESAQPWLSPITVKVLQHSLLQ